MMSRTTEDTPLLSDPTANELGSPTDERYDPIVERHQQRCAKTIFILTWSSALLAVFILVLDMTIICVHLVQFGSLRSWGPEFALIGTFFTLLGAGFISFLNLARLYLWNRPIWLWLNLVLDLAIVFYSFGFGMLGSGIGDLGSWGADILIWFIRITQVVCWLVVVFGLIHLALFFVRCFLSFSYRPWREYRNWTLPRGRLSIEFKVQFLRQSDNSEASPDATTSGTGIQAEVAAQSV
ncbi:uncharacterized protein N7511_002716 [Penicillium nucicola]|uniref:uncharacterized protein n=1 Tax=Penicillium nucicola TaxID=1850975 RepID=UPI0025458570|nr:uncharacterized protein N7511_002716 [Penicillium nucicola]KAJ5770665.1 hypothetical protein N7511_002716 [Penicillium nucicola]